MRVLTVWMIMDFSSEISRKKDFQKFLAKFLKNFQNYCGDCRTCLAKCLEKKGHNPDHHANNSIHPSLKIYLRKYYEAWFQPTSPAIFLRVIFNKPSFNDHFIVPVMGSTAKRWPSSVDKSIKWLFLDGGEFSTWIQEKCSNQTKPNDKTKVKLFTL